MRHRRGSALRRRYGHAKATCRKVLTDLYQYAVGNRGSREGNPYLKSDVAAARKFLGDD